jgi:hypothetical protein
VLPLAARIAPLVNRTLDSSGDPRTAVRTIRAGQPMPLRFKSRNSPNSHERMPIISV